MDIETTKQHISGKKQLINKLIRKGIHSLLILKEGAIRRFVTFKEQDDKKRYLVNRVRDVAMRAGEIYNFLKARYESSPREKLRMQILFFSMLFVFDYLLFCVHTDKNIFDIFPSIPELEQKHEVIVYLPATDGKSILTEKRSIPQLENDERLAGYLFNAVLKGSRFENTAVAIPVDLFVRKIWITKEAASVMSGEEKTCIFDVEPSLIREDAVIIPGSEELFRDALQKTITGNINTIKHVKVIENGIPERKLWEM